MYCVVEKNVKEVKRSLLLENPNNRAQNILSNVLKVGFKIEMDSVFWV